MKQRWCWCSLLALPRPLHLLQVKLQDAQLPAYLAKLREKYDDGSYVAAVAARLPAAHARWAPHNLRYRSGASPTCAPGDFASNCAPRKWNPATAEVLP